MRLFAAVVLSCVLTGCATRAVRVDPRPATTLAAGGHIDLQAGWRLRVVTPLLKSGGFRLPVISEHTEGNVITVRAKDEFIGYETAYYAVRPRETGVRVTFDSAEAIKEGNTTPQSRSAVSLFELPRCVKHVRLI